MKIKVVVANDKENFIFILTKKTAYFENIISKKSILKLGDYKEKLNILSIELSKIKCKNVNCKHNYIKLTKFCKTKKIDFNNSEIKTLKDNLYNNFILEFAKIDKNIFKNI